MKKFINSVDTVLAESLDGFAAAHADIVVLGAERKFIRRRSPNPNKVALISGGGSGHEPLHAGLVGTGMLDAAETAPSKNAERVSPVITHCAATVCIQEPTLLVNCADHSRRYSGKRSGAHPPSWAPAGSWASAPVPVIALCLRYINTLLYGPAAGP